MLGIVRDVTDSRRVQAQLLQAEKMSAIGQLVGGMAHEINNPLASILVNMELLLGEAQDPSQLETLHAIKVETDRAAQIVRNLLTYVRGQGSERAVVDLREAVRGAPRPAAQPAAQPADRGRRSSCRRSRCWSGATPSTCSRC